MRIPASPHPYIGVGLCERRREPLPVYVRDGTGTGGETGASNASNAAPVSHTRTCTLYTSNQTFIRLSGVSHPDRSMPFLRSFSVKFLSYITYARVWETGAALLALLALLGASIRT